MERQTLTNKTRICSNVEVVDIIPCPNGNAF